MVDSVRGGGPSAQRRLAQALEPARPQPGAQAQPATEPAKGRWGVPDRSAPAWKLRAADGGGAPGAGAAGVSAKPAGPNPALMKREVELGALTDKVNELRQKNGMEPDAKAEAARVKWEPVGEKGKLYVDDISYDDVVQGTTIGDCFLVSSLASQALANKEVIRNAITDNHDGTYSVRFFEKSAKGFKPVTVTVTDELPQAKGKAVYLHGRDGNEGELWGPILEKAYAQWKGGYEEIGNGGTPAEVLEALTGKKAIADLPLFMEEKGTATAIQQAIAQHRAIVAGTWPEGSKGGERAPPLGLIAGHAYSVVGLKEENGTKYVEVRNPWGKANAGTPGADTGLIKLSLKDFANAFATVTH